MVDLEEYNVPISTATGSFFAGRRASTYRIGLPMLGNDLRMWLNPSDTPTTTSSTGSNALLSIIFRKYYSVGTTHINNISQQGTEDNKEIIVFDHSSNEYLSTGSLSLSLMENHWAPSQAPSNVRQH